MSRYPFDWVDAFTTRAFGGNGCAVVHGGADLDTDVCTGFVRETSLVECTFTGPSDVADVRVRYFLADREIPFAGHPTIATVAAMRARGMIAGGEITLETGAGLVPVQLDGDRIAMTQIAPDFGAEVDPARVAAAVGLSPADIIAPPQLVSTGLPFVITVLRDHEALRAARLDLDGMAALATAIGQAGAPLMEPFLVTLQGATEVGDTFSRLILAPPSPPEDPFTGSATGAMAAYLWRHGLMPGESFTAEQGHWLGRPGQARVSRLGPVEAMTGIRVAGAGFVLMTGEVDLPAAMD
ncbi:PhzF family phenazine biosynthesis protein [Antarcticimicrobium sediminis]|uniref:PhzF family phenazine biosynthesis protein n=1 Tax=Antarcticimicrobium sediminis TaxID=2546227 RepID=A0A4V2Z7J2_9RHOB|nr:PhzF family phenazine biosynthesis protein [Antarcticimicrobium sediminis]TDE36656.1 PhzF family phenazine biosynthesis protein [Antarcticimicrobium sediminis]